MEASSSTRCLRSKWPRAESDDFSRTDIHRLGLREQHLDGRRVGIRKTTKENQGEELVVERYVVAVQLVESGAHDVRFVLRVLVFLNTGLRDNMDGRDELLHFSSSVALTQFLA